MPFSRSLQHDNVHRAPPDAVKHNGLPSFISSGAPTLAPGGGAEVLPFKSTWLTNSGPPGAAVRCGEPLRFTSQQAVNTLRKTCAADKEVQTSIVNFRKDGSAFINLVSVIPITGGKHELNDVVYLVGFRVDLTEQPNIILDKLRDGTYAPTEPGSPDHPSAAAAAHALHLHQPIVHRRTPLSLILLEYAPDFIHVVSLKGAFQYVAPAVTRVLEYTPSELVGKSLADLAHPEDIVPLERQLKESSTLLPSAPSAAVDDTTAAGQPHPHALAAVQARIIDVLFWARTKAGVYVWVECRGRLHVEPGKGRKAIILSGRARAMPRLCLGTWFAEGEREKTARMTYREIWVQLAGRGRSAGAVVAVRAGLEDVLGYTAKELMGRRIGTLVVEGREGVCEALKEDISLSAGKAKEGLAGEEETH
ncbi:putative PAS domain containing protein [Lyophyllum shimeji]|uniref:PAS domain containing protein n=1 Tax=Lyophyllum shimeji TaxID=47721 RepID=A0A9P3PUN2_LYOSH|nr:putative PAS domain containing protein [Lyophyllum shimeji]